MTNSWGKIKKTINLSSKEIESGLVLCAALCSSGASWTNYLPAKPESLLTEANNGYRD